MNLHRLQLDLEEIYRIGGYPSVDQFLISAPEVSKLLPEESAPRPQVLLKEEEGSVRLAVHIELEALQALADEVMELSDFCGVAEEVSHYLYLSWRALNDRPASLLDLEVQGEIDKFLLARRYIADSQDLFERMFERVVYDERLDEEGRERYRLANLFGGKFCRALKQEDEPLERLRVFYRLASPARLSELEKL